MSAWFDHAFGSWYLRLYPHRDTAEAERAMAMLLPSLPTKGRMLDVGCGAGRHAAFLREQGMDIVGIDRSPQLLAAARTRPPLRGRLLRGDMRRLPFPDRSLAAVLSMFTSFGYFGPRLSHVKLLEEFHRVCRPGGTLILDYLNATRTRESLVPETRREIERHQVVEKRKLDRGPDGEQAIKTVTITDREGSVVERYEERVSLYDRPELQEMLAEANWSCETVFGEYDGSAWSPRSSRTLVVAHVRDGH